VARWSHHPTIPLHKRPRQVDSIAVRGRFLRERINMRAGLLRVLVLAVVWCAPRYHHAGVTIRGIMGRRELVEEHVSGALAGWHFSAPDLGDPPSLPPYGW
jgi:hypothetical protein